MRGHSWSFQDLLYTQCATSTTLYPGEYMKVSNLSDLGDEGVEWLMATASSPEGNIPARISERAMPRQISSEVPAFRKWIASKGWKK